MIYLASPYTADTQEDRHHRAIQAGEAVAAILKRGITAYSPVVHSAGVPGADSFHHEVWMRHCIEILEGLKNAHRFQLWVLQIDGWNHSKGVAAEVKWAETNGVIVRYLNPRLENLGHLVTQYLRGDASCPAWDPDFEMPYTLVMEREVKVSVEVCQWPYPATKDDPGCGLDFEFRIEGMDYEKALTTDEIDDLTDAIDRHFEYYIREGMTNERTKRG